ncbi:MAG TPA: hypothetical protein VH479_06465 [Acidimicrobiales bacterium]
MATIGPSPREKPLSYPGQTPRTSGLMTGTTFLSFERLRARRLAQARVVLGDDRPAALSGVTSRCTLGYALLVLNAVPIEARVPVLAVGSNASISQMEHKFATAGISSVMPLTWAQVTGVRVGVAAMISRWGYVPAAPVFEPGVTSRLALNWLDPEQLEALDETELGYDRRLVVDGDGTRVELESGERLAGCGIYVPRRGVLAEPEGKPMDLPREQRQLIETLIARAGRPLRRLAGDADAFVAAAADRQKRAALSEMLLSCDAVPVVTSSGPTRPGDPETYGAARAGLPPPGDAAGALRVAPSPDEIDRRGEPTVAVSPACWDELGRPSHVVVHSCMDPMAPAAVGRVVEVDTDEVLVDQAIRNGIGVEIGEHVTLEPASVVENHVADLLLSTPHSLLCRVQQAELVTSERRAALLSRLALELIGIESGDRVVVEGLPAEPGGKLRTVTVRAFEAPGETLDRRERLGGGGFQHRFPAARDALGVYPDLPGIFIDRALRSELGLAQPQLAVVRVRASRKDQVTKETREMLLVVVLAFIGLLQVVDVGWTWVAFVLLTAMIVLGIVGMRLRSRLREV